MQPTLVALLERTVTEPGSECVLWTGSTVPSGKVLRYGVVHIDGRTNVLVHRLMWALVHGPIPDGMKVCHRCDVPTCVNPDHLFLGTQRDNMRDCAAKGRIDASRRTRCPAGHVYSAENTYRPPTTGKRHCRICRREGKARRRAAA